MNAKILKSKSYDDCRYVCMIEEEAIWLFYTHINHVYMGIEGLEEKFKFIEVPKT